MSDPCDSSSFTDGTGSRARRHGSLTLDIVEEDGDWSALAGAVDLVRRAGDAVAAAPELDFGHAGAAIALSCDDSVKALNATYRGKDKPTNVLSFPAPATLPGAPGAPRFLGDVVLAAETVMREAQEIPVPAAHHLQHLVVHGLLHLLGFDHESDAEAERMEKLETTILARLGIDDPYAEPTT